MASYCPSCGAEVKKGNKFCLSCGADLRLGSSFEEQVAQTPVVNASIPAQQPVLQQQYSQTQGYMPMQPKKSNMKLIIAIIAIIVVIAVIAVVLFVVLGVGSDSSKFVGTWNIASSGGSSIPTGATMTFESNGDLKTGYSGVQTTIGKWSVEGGKICLTITTAGTGKQCASYSFSNGGNTLTINDPTGGGNNLVLTK